MSSVVLPLTGSRVVVRDWRLDDLPVYRAFSQPGQAWQALDGPYYPRLAGEELDRHVTMIESRIKSAEWPEPRMVAVIADRDTDEMIGRVSRYWESQETNWLAAGVVVYDSARWRQGLGYEALGLWCQYLFDTMPEICRLDLRTWSGNRGMMRLAEKLGFELEATFRKARFVGEEYYDGLGYGVLREEWTARYPGGFTKHL